MVINNNLHYRFPLVSLLSSAQAAQGVDKTRRPLGVAPAPTRQSYSPISSQRFRKTTPNAATALHTQKHLKLCLHRLFISSSANISCLAPVLFQPGAPAPGPRRLGLPCLLTQVQVQVQRIPSTSVHLLCQDQNLSRNPRYPPGASLLRSHTDPQTSLPKFQNAPPRYARQPRHGGVVCILATCDPAETFLQGRADTLRQRAPDGDSGRRR